MSHPSHTLRKSEGYHLAPKETLASLAWESFIGAIQRYTPDAIRDLAENVWKGEEFGPSDTLPENLKTEAAEWCGRWHLTGLDGKPAPRALRAAETDLWLRGRARRAFPGIREIEKYLSAGSIFEDTSKWAVPFVAGPDVSIDTPVPVHVPIERSEEWPEGLQKIEMPDVSWMFRCGAITVARARDWALKEYGRHLDAYIHRLKVWGELSSMQFASAKRTENHLEWFVRFQVGRESLDDIAGVNLEVPAVRKACKHLAGELGLRLRRQMIGRKPGPSKTKP